LENRLLNEQTTPCDAQTTPNTWRRELNFVSEALNPSQYREYVKEFNRERYENSFRTLGDKYEHDRNYYRIYIPLESSTNVGPISNTEKEVSDFLSKNGYQVLDYIKGIAKFGESKNTTSIGKALTKLKSDDLMKKFVSDESRKSLTSDASNLMVVISRHPYDIAGSDTDRNWTNCMTMAAHPNSKRLAPLLNQYDEKLKEKNKWDEYFNNVNVGKINPSKEELETNLKDYHKSKYDSESMSKLRADIDNRKVSGQNVKYIIHDVKEGSLTSYLIKKDDKNIQNPIAVLNIKPYINEKDSDDFLLISDSNMYGQGRPEFKKTVDNVLSLINKPVSGLFCLNKKLYNDSGRPDVFINGGKEEEFFQTSLDKVKKIANSSNGEKLLTKKIFDEINSQVNLIPLYLKDLYNLNLDNDEIKRYSNIFASEVRQNLPLKLKNKKFDIDINNIKDYFNGFLSDFPKDYDNVDKFAEYFIDRYFKYNRDVNDTISSEFDKMLDEFVLKIK